MVDSFVHLHVHTEYSMLDGAAKIAPLMAETTRLGMPAIAMTDHGNMFGAYEFHAAAQKAGIKPIIGVEAYVAPGSRHYKKPIFWGQAGQRNSDDGTGEGGDVSGGGAYTHMTMWATGPRGLRNLFKLSSVASLEGYYRKPRMDAELIAQYSEEIIATTGCPSGEIQTRLRLGQFDEALAAAATYQEIFGKDNFFLELMDHGLAIEQRVRSELLDIAKRLGLRPVVTNDSHYVTRDQADAHDALLCVGTGSTLVEEKRFKLSGDGYYLRDAREMRELWDREVAGACDATLAIAERVEPYDEVFAYRNLMPRFPVPENETQSSWLRKEAARGARARFGDNPPREVTDRIDYELRVIDEMGFPAYFLVVADICQYAKSNGIRVGPGRGSATGSMVAYVVGITDLNPLEHSLIFERFLNPERVTMPDVDLDFDERRRGDMIAYVTELYGERNVAQILTFSVIKAKAAVKDACRVLGYPYALGDRISKAFPPAVMGKEIPLSGMFEKDHPRYNEASELRKLYEDEADVRRIIDTARGLEGLTRGTGVHAAGVILSSEELIDVLPIHRRDADGAVITGFPFTQAEEMGLLKMDFLGLRNLTVIDDAIRNIKASQGLDIDLETLPLADDKTFALLAHGDTLGVFQLDGGPMRSLLRLMSPTKFGDIAAVLALYRPGPMAANTHINYADRKNGRQKIVPIHPELAEVLEPILGETYHLVVYQEQVMAIAQQLAGYSLGKADLLRRAMGKKKKELLDSCWEEFASGMAANGFSAGATKAIWDVLVPFSGYGFNKSHTAGYGVVSFWTAYLKANYPAEYMAALLTSVGDDKDKMAVYLAECRKMGIKVLLPDVNESSAQFTPRGADVRFGLSAIRNVGTNVVEAIEAARRKNGQFTDFVDFLQKVDTVVCNKRTIDSLIKAGAFDSLGHTRQELCEQLDSAVDAVISIKREEANGQFDLFGSVEDNGRASGVLGLDLAFSGREYAQKEKLAFERDMLGLYVSSHPLDGIAHLLRAKTDCSIVAMKERREGDHVAIGGIMSGLQRRVTKQGKLWASATIEDLDASVEAMFFPATYESVSEHLADDAIVIATGRVQFTDGSPRLIATEAATLDVSQEAANTPLAITLPATSVTADLASQLREILAAHPGNTAVHIRLQGSSQTTLLAVSNDLRISHSSALVGELKELLGRFCLTPA